MANPRRKMCTIRRVDDVLPIEGADRIELARIGGWQVVVSKSDGFKAGDLCAYYEIDSFLPADDERYAGFQSDTPKVMVVDGRAVKGTVLRTRKFRGAYSQGLCLRPEDVLPESIPAYAYERMCEKNVDVSNLVNVWEWVPLQPMNAGFSGKYDPFIAPRTDAERIQNIDERVWDLIRGTVYEVSVKVDGTSITMLYDDRTDELTYYSHNNRFDMTSGGIPKIVSECAEKQGLADFCRANHMVTLQAELVGPKIQSNRFGLHEHRLMVFSIWDVRKCHYMSLSDIDGFEHGQAVCDSFVPVIDTGVLLDEFDNPKDFLAYADGIKGYVTKGRLDEGLVIHVLDKGELTHSEWVELLNALGSTAQCKAVSNRYLMKAKE